MTTIKRGGIALLAASTALLGTAFLGSSPSSASTLISESFRGASTPAGWEMESPRGSHLPCLTAAPKPVPAGSLPSCNAGPSDKPGQGVFQLTDNSNNDGGNLLLDKAIPATAGLQISFDFFQYHTTTAKGADGISFFLIDGAQENITAGETGGMLGYKGLKGGLVGIGFDEYGNFSNPDCVKGKKDACGVGGPGLRPNNVAVRGAESTGYKYVAGETSPGPLAVDKVSKREDARRTAVVSLSTAGTLNVSIDFHDGRGVVKVLNDIDLNAIEGQPKLPETIKLGFSGSTGGATNIHEIRDFSVTSLDPKLAVKASGAASVGVSAEGTIKLDVSNAADAGPTSDTVSVTYAMPAVYKAQPGFKLVSAEGDGWDCTVGPVAPTDEETPGGDDEEAAPAAEDLVSCTRPGKGDDALEPATSCPPITVHYTGGTVPLREVPTTATVTTAGSPDGSATLPVSVNEAASGPDLTSTIKHTGTALAGGPLTYELTVANNASAGPSAEKVTATFTAPEGTTIASVQPGDGWDCTQLAQSVTCTRSDVLKPGAAYPPIGVTVTLPGQGTDTTLTPLGLVNAGDDTNPDNNAAPADPVTLAFQPPRLNAAISHDGTPLAGGLTTYHLVVGDAKDSGPTSGTVTATFTAPPGSTVKSATGDGWTCKIDGTLVTCTRDDMLAPGSFYPPVNVDVQYPAGSPGTPVSVTGTVSLGNDEIEATPDKTTLGEPAGQAKTGVSVTVQGDPGAFVPGKPFVYTVTVTNEGPDSAKGVQLDLTLPDIWTKIPWKCVASEGSGCPKPAVVDGVPVPLTGSLATTIDVAAGGKVVLTVGCVIPGGYSGAMDLALTYAPPVGAVDSKCADKCTGKVTTKQG